MFGVWYPSNLAKFDLATQFGPAGMALDYVRDTAQRSVLFWDVMRKRGNQYRLSSEAMAPHVLSFTPEILLDGRTLERPVNYALVRIVPPKGVEIDETRRPFVVVDPRAGHGPGIGGFKADSEIGVALAAGHPCYFIGFLPEPVKGQTIEDIALAEAIFLEKVIALHPDADAKPCVIGNCQAGWAVMMLAAVRPELFGSIIIAGAPLSYWAGERGKYPMRYTGGLLGGSWLTALAGDLGHGKFDGAWLVQNFENQNPANTLWSKQYNPLFQDRYRGTALSRLRAMVGQPRQPQCRGNPVHRRRAFRRQQSRRRPYRDFEGRSHRSQEHPRARRRLLLQRRQHHPARPGARLDHRSL
ncbi:hypothetical protein FHX15_002015 [Rhizobium sp. BK650]|nr:hypothetical protein [Rhizobium sp. BK650]